MEKAVKEIYEHLRRNYSVDHLYRVGILPPFKGVTPMGKIRFDTAQKQQEELHFARLAIALSTAGEDPNRIVVAFDRLMEQPAKRGDVIMAIRYLHGVVGRKILKDSLYETEMFNDKTLDVAGQKLRDQQARILRFKQVKRSIKTLQRYVNEFWSER